MPALEGSWGLGRQLCHCLALAQKPLSLNITPFPEKTPGHRQLDVTLPLSSWRD